DLDFISGGDTADQLVTGFLGMLCGSQDGRNVIARVGVVGSQEGVVVVEFTNGYAIGPSCPFRGYLVVNTKYGRTGPTGGRGVSRSLCTGRDNWCTVQ